MVMAGAALIAEDPEPTEEQIKYAIRGNVCRCTGYKKIIEGISLAAAVLRGEKQIDEDLERGDDYGVGKRAFRIDVRKKVLGEGKYPDDIDELDQPGLTYASAVRSKYPRARVLSIDTSKAEALPGVVGILRAEDVPVNQVGHLIQDWDVMIAQGDITRCVGDAIVLVVAEDEATLEKAKKLVKIDYEPLEPVRNIVEARAEDAPRLHDSFFAFGNTVELKDNVCQSRHVTRGDAAKALAESGAAFAYSDEALFEKTPEHPRVGHFKPDYAPEYLMAVNYICHLAVFKKSLFDAVGGERPACDGAQDHDLFLRLIDEMQRRDPAAKPLHIPQVLYYWRVHAASTSGGTAAKPYVEKAAQKAVADHLAATGRQGKVEPGKFPGTCHVVWDIPEPQPLVSILIPNKDHTDDLEKCLHSIYAKTTYENFEVIVIENNSTDPATAAYYKKLPERYDRARVVTYKGGFNFSRINNFGRRYATGKYLLLLNNDVEVINGDWLTQMVGECSQPGVGLCGAMLYYPDDTIQHAGIITGLGGYAGHSHKYHKRGGSGYMFRLATVQDFSAVTAACLLVRTAVYDELHGLDEEFTVAYNDVDFCLRVRDAGWRIVWTPYAELYHYESKSRGSDENDPAKKARFDAEHERLYAVHGRENILHDPYYSPSLSLDYEDFRESGDLRNLK